MPAVKRKASTSLSDGRPSKLTKRTTSATVSRTMSSVTTLSKKTSLKPLHLTTKASSTAGVKKAPSTLRRVATLTIEEPKETLTAKSSTASVAKSLSKSSRSLSKSSRSLSKSSRTLSKQSSFAEVGALVTRLSGLKSGSLVGETALADALSVIKKPSLTKAPSKKSSTAGSKTPSLPSGLTKFALSKTKSISSIHLSKSASVDNIDEAEVASALATLRSHASVEKSKSADEEMPSAEEAAAVGEVEKVASTGPGGVALPPGGLVEVAISFDTTGSMYGCLMEVRSKVQDLVQRLQADIPGIRIAIIAHGDYCDADKYIVKWIDFGASVPEICDFVKNVESTYGGDGPECYELVLQRAREVLTWTPGSQRVLIMIGDDEPHEPGYKYGGKTYHINWVEECAELLKMGVKVYGVQAGSDSGSTRFNQQMAKLTNGCHLPLSDFSSIFDFLMMICYREGNPDMMPLYEQEVRARHMGGMAKDFAGLAKTFGSAAPTGILTAVPVKAAKKGPRVVKTARKPKAKTAAKAGPKITKPKTIGKKKGRSLLSDTIQKREKVPDASLSKGPLAQLAWSKWVCAVKPTLPAKSSGKFTKCHSTSGYRLKSIFRDDTKTPAVYELAVQIGGRGKKHVVYYRKSIGYRKRGAWDLYLLRHKLVKQEVDRVVKAGCSIWVRRGEAKGADAKTTVKSAQKYIDTQFDYAWKKYIWRKTGHSLKHRQLKVPKSGPKSFLVSSSDL